MSNLDRLAHVMDNTSEQVVGALRQPRESVSEVLDELGVRRVKTLDDDEVREVVRQLECETEPVFADD